MRTRTNHIFFWGKAAAYHTNQQHKFLHRLHMTHFDPVSLSELLDRIDASKYHEKTKKKMRRIAKRRTAAFRSQPSVRIVGLRNLTLLNC